ncbi:MAG: hypothetical protein KAY46_05350 [Burkholderiaceae bacterium]|nr:hypothetical protein [Burkholderiaceae bacterium]
MDSSLIIAPRFNGPAHSGNGGYGAGLLAARWLARRGHDRHAGIATLPVEVTLRAPLPLGKPLQLLEPAVDVLALMDDNVLLAQARAAELALEPPASPTLDEAAAAGALGRLHAARGMGNSYLTCFGCGVGREAHDGLRIVPSPVGDDGVVASDWTPHGALVDAQGQVPDEIIWAALDCPAGIAWNHRLRDGPPLVTGQMTVVIEAPVLTGRPHVVIGWPIAADGRKLHAGSALFDESGRLLARSRQLWLIPRA